MVPGSGDSLRQLVGRQTRSATNSVGEHSEGQQTNYGQKRTSTGCEWEGDVVAVVGPLGGVAQVVSHGVKVVGVHGEEGAEKDEEVRWK